MSHADVEASAASEESSRAADLPQRLLDDRAVVLLPASIVGSPVAAVEVLVQEGLTTLSMPASRLEELGSLRGMYAARAEFLVHHVGTTDEVHRCADAGVQVVLLRRADAELVAAARQRGLAVVAPALTPTEVQSVWDLGVSAVLVVPADVFGGQYAEQLAELVPDARLVPCGGIGAYSGGRWLDAGALAVCLDEALVGDAFGGGSLSSLRERAQTFRDAVARH